VEVSSPEIPGVVKLLIHNHPHLKPSADDLSHWVYYTHHVFRGTHIMLLVRSKYLMQPHVGIIRLPLSALLACCHVRNNFSLHLSLPR
jgi:hypothetical protein